MSQDINKDLLISILTERNGNLDKIVQLQKEQLNTYKEKDLTLEKMVELLETLVNSHAEQIKILEQTVEDQKKIIEVQNTGKGG